MQHNKGTDKRPCTVQQSSDLLKLKHVLPRVDDSLNNVKIRVENITTGLRCQPADALTNAKLNSTHQLRCSFLSAQHHVIQYTDYKRNMSNVVWNHSQLLHQMHSILIVKWLLWLLWYA